MRVLMSVLVGLLGAVVGAAIGVALTYALLSGSGADALSWAVVGVVCSVPLTLGGAVTTSLLCRRLFPGPDGLRGSVGYGIGAAIAVLVVGPAVAIHYATRDTSGPDLLEGKLCRKPGIRYMGTATQGVKVCFTLTADRKEQIEVGWSFSLSSGCGGGGATSDTSEVPLDGPGQIHVPGFTGTIRGARASGVLKDPDICPGKTFRWSAREIIA